MANIVGSGAPEVLIGTSGDDVFYPGEGADSITGNGRIRIDELNYSNLYYPDFPQHHVPGLDIMVSDAAGAGTLTVPRQGVIPFNPAIPNHGVRWFYWYETYNISATGINAVAGTYGADELSGGSGGQLFYGLRGADTIDGGAGEDEISYARDAVFGAIDGFGGPSGIYADVRHGYVIDGFLDRDTIRNIEIITGTAGRDKIIAGDGAASFYGGDGGDTFIGGLGNDNLSGESGNDHIYGGGGRNVISGGEGYDTLIGGSDDDYISGGSGSDDLHGGDGNDTVLGGEGDDYFVGGNGANSLHGDAGNDSLNDGDGNGYLVGGSGDDGMFGGYGNDQFFSGSGFDWMVGGAGADLFIFMPGDGADTIVDFNVLEDHINVGFVPGIDSFADVQARMSFNGINTIIDFGGGDMITLMNVRPETLTGEDFHI